MPPWRGLSYEHESWYGTDSKDWFYVSLIMSIGLVIVGIAAGCEAAGRNPERPLYVECVEK